jgi:N-methylhydantoinase A
MKRIAIDIGGTFTDITYIDEDSMELLVDKVETTPGDLSQGVIDAITKLDCDIREVNVVVHGTTVGMNTLIQRNGARVGLITTKGFRDVYEIARGDRPEMYDFLYKKPKPLVPRNLRVEVEERVDYAGRILEKLSEEDARAAAQFLQRAGVEAIALCYLHSYANPAHELTTAELIHATWPDVHISLSHKVAREFREYERTSTTVLDAYIKKNIEDYLDKLTERLAKHGLKGLLLITSASGALSIPVAREKAITTIVSGPTSGAIGAARLGNLLDIANLVTMDVGGTSFDLSLIRNGRNVEREEGNLVGFPMLVPSIDILTIGAGGGSIARVDVGGMLTVGPDSAGANPGPMCYGKGGTEPTVTDAALVNGLIDAGNFLGGEIALDEAAAKRGVTSIASKLGIDFHQAAEGILTICKNNMTNATREILVSRGCDPREFTALAYGGGGGIFAGGIAKDLGIGTIIIPFAPGVFSAWGMLSTDFVHNFSHTHISDTHELDFDAVNVLYDEMFDEAMDLFAKEGVSEQDMEFIRTVDMRYQGQGHHVEVLLLPGDVSDAASNQMIERFKATHKSKYGHQLEAPTETVNFRLKAIGKIKDVEVKQLPIAPISKAALKRMRRVFLEGKSIECPIYDRLRLTAGNHIDGPAIIEEPVHTTVVTAEQHLDVDKYGNLHIAY